MHIWLTITFLVIKKLLLLLCLYRFQVQQQLTFSIVKAASLIAYQNKLKLDYIMPQTTARKVLNKQNETHLGLFSTGKEESSSRHGECYEEKIVFFQYCIYWIQFNQTSIDEQKPNINHICFATDFVLQQEQETLQYAQMPKSIAFPTIINFLWTVCLHRTVTLLFQKQYNEVSFIKVSSV